MGLLRAVLVAVVVEVVLARPPGGDRCVQNEDAFAQTQMSQMSPKPDQEHACHFLLELLVALVSVLVLAVLLIAVH